VKQLWTCPLQLAINQWLQCRLGPMVGLPPGERVYIWLSLIAKSLLAWQIFANNSSSADLITSRPGSTTRRTLSARERIAFEQIQQLSY
jgi:hypothetical protein